MTRDSRKPAGPAYRGDLVRQEQIARSTRGRKRRLSVLDDPVHLGQCDQNLSKDRVDACF